MTAVEETDINYYAHTELSVVIPTFNEHDKSSLCLIAHLKVENPRAEYL